MCDAHVGLARRIARALQIATRGESALLSSVAMTKQPTEREQVEALLKSDARGPFVMMSLFKFREKTESGEKGEHVYARYLGRVVPLAEKVGARLVWYGDARDVFAGSPSEGWDRALLVEYPSRAAFAQMFGTPDYQASLAFRDAALEKIVMLVSNPIGT
jgi:uncharacterized protein (DUF1330 family)